MDVLHIPRGPLNSARVVSPSGRGSYSLAELHDGGFTPIVDLAGRCLQLLSLESSGRRGCSPQVEAHYWEGITDLSRERTLEFLKEEGFRTPKAYGLAGERPENFAHWITASKLPLSLRLYLPRGVFGREIVLVNKRWDASGSPERSVDYHLLLKDK